MTTAGRLLLLHGVGGTHRFWDPTGLPGAIDLPGIAGPLELARAVRPAEPTVVIGHSLGGMVAQELALQSDRTVTAMVLCCTIPGTTRRVTMLNDTAAAFVEEHGMRAHAEQVVPRLCGPGTPVELRQHFIEELAGADPTDVAAKLRAIGRWQARDRLATCGVPALVVAGEHEPNLADQRELASLLGAELVVVPGAGHMAPAEKPAEFLDAVSPFLQEHS